MKKTIVIFLVFVCVAACTFAKKMPTQKISTTQSISYIGGKYAPIDSPSLSISTAMKSGEGKFLLKYDFTVQNNEFQKYPVLCLILIPKRVYPELKNKNNLQLLGKPLYTLPFNASARSIFEGYAQVGRESGSFMTEKEFLDKIVNATSIDEALELVWDHSHDRASLVIPPYRSIEEYVFDDHDYVLPIVLPSRKADTASIELSLDVSQIGYYGDDSIEISLMYYWLYNGGMVGFGDDEAFVMSDKNYEIALKE